MGRYQTEKTNLCNMCTATPELKKKMCYICVTQRSMRGKWKMVIIWLLKEGTKRFNELQKSIPQIKQGSLTLQLRELELDGYINRKVYDTIPPQVEYSLTQSGLEFLDVMDKMYDWGRKHALDILKKAQAES